MVLFQRTTRLTDCCCCCCCCLPPMSFQKLSPHKRACCACALRSCVRIPFKPNVHSCTIREGHASKLCCLCCLTMFFLFFFSLILFTRRLSYALLFSPFFLFPRDARANRPCHSHASRRSPRAGGQHEHGKCSCCCRY